ncbi:MAG: hypothetical protein P4L99_10485 [Chthoniobacter sp.]|nr:hypothetical protein [Chthoniobacter sp.]
MKRVYPLVSALAAGMCVPGCAIPGHIDSATRRTVEDNSATTSAMWANQSATDQMNAQMASDQAVAASTAAANQAAADGAASAAAANQ